MNRPAAPPYARHSAWVAWCTLRAVERRARAIDSPLTLFALAVWQVLAACERGLGFGIPHSHLNHLNSMQEGVRYFHWRVEEVAQHGQGPAWALPQLGSCASPGRARRLGAAWAARCSQGEAGPLGAPPRPRGLELAATRAADFTAIFYQPFLSLSPCRSPAGRTNTTRTGRSTSRRTSACRACPKRSSAHWTPGR